MIRSVANNRHETKLVRVIILECDHEYLEQIGKFDLDVTTEYEVAPNLKEFKIIAVRCAIRCVENRGYTICHNLDGGYNMYVSADEDYIMITTC